MDLLCLKEVDSRSLRRRSIRLNLSGHFDLQTTCQNSHELKTSQCLRDSIAYLNFPLHFAAKAAAMSD